MGLYRNAKGSFKQTNQENTLGFTFFLLLCINFLFFQQLWILAS